MGLIPSKREDQVTFFENHEDPWTLNAVAIGLTAPIVTALIGKVDNARKAFQDMEAARLAARAATQNFYNMCDDMLGDGRECVRLIKNKALATGDPNVWVLAQLPPPAQPAPLPPPGQPFDFRAALESDGSITFRWKAVNPQGSAGIVWTVRRRLAGESGFSFLGASGTRAFTDNTLPAGTPSAQYVVFGQRGQSVGQPSAPFVVQFGVGGGGFTITSQFMDENEGGGAKLAA